MARGFRLGFALLMTVALLSLPAPRLSAQESDGVDGSTYTSPSYGYSLSWNDQIWTVDEAYGEGGYDLLHLTGAEIDLFVEGDTGFAANLDECISSSIDFYSNEEGVTGVEPVEGTDSSGDGYAAVAILVSAEDDQGPYDLKANLFCFELSDGAYATVTAVGNPDDVDVAEQDVVAVVESFAPGEGGTQPEDGGGDIEAFMNSATQDINAFWTDQFATWDQQYEAPAFISFQDETVETGCGEAAPGENGPFYCPDDLTVYMDMVGIDQEVSKYGRVIVSVTIAHEIGHHIQALLGLEGCGESGCGNVGGSLAIELQADCFAGSWIASADSRELINADDVEKAVIAIAEYFGDPPGTSLDDPDAHGPGKLRTWWFLKGYYEGADTCLADSNGTESETE